MRLTIRTRLLAWIILPTLLIYLLVAITALVFLEQVEERYARERMTAQATNYARQFDLLLRQCAVVADTSARLLEIEPQPSEDQIFALLETNVVNHRFVFGSACAFEPGTFKTDDTLYSPYVCRNISASGPDGLRRMNITREVYDWYNDPQWQWFRKPKQQGTGTWTDPYFDEGAGNALMTTYSAPFFRDGRFRGVITVDILLPALQQTLGGEIDSELDFAVMTADGQFVYTRETERILKQTVFDMLNEFGRADLKPIAQQALRGSAGVADVAGWDTNQRQWLFYAPIRSTHWTFLSRLPESVVLQEARRKALALVGVLGLTMALTTLAILLVSSRITGPISRLKNKVMQIAGGDLQARVDDVTGHDEVADLARSFNAMADDLQGHIRRIAEQEAAKQRLDHELDLAREIQMGLLPRDPPGIPGYDIAGWSRPAAKTGGDYFDWQPLPGGKIVISIADATGHGIGPALVTAVCRAYARASFPSGSDVAALVARINDLLAQDLPGDRFVTFVAAMLDPQAHALQLVSAGHGPQFLYHARERRLERLDSDGLPLAVLPSAEFGKSPSLQLEVGDVLFMVTDGFFEWMDNSDRIYGLDRLAESLAASVSRPAADIISAAYAGVLAFANGTPQQDDLTAVVIKRVS
jgi:sigma-B regulation protein RsbU (phosphoserine phosphatase)